MNDYIQEHYDEPRLKGKFSIELTVDHFYELDDDENYPCDVADSIVEFWDTEE
jgi:hypothetical protein